MREIVSRLEKLPKSVQDSAVWKSHIGKGARGDYGMRETFSYNGQDIIAYDIDGARGDVRHFADIELIEKFIQENT